MKKDIITKANIREELERLDVKRNKALKKYYDIVVAEKSVRYGDNVVDFYLYKATSHDFDITDLLNRYIDKAINLKQLIDELYNLVNRIEEAKEEEKEIEEKEEEKETRRSSKMKLYILQKEYIPVDNNEKHKEVYKKLWQRAEEYPENMELFIFKEEALKKLKKLKNEIDRLGFTVYRLYEVEADEYHEGMDMDEIEGDWLDFYVAEWDDNELFEYEIEVTEEGLLNYMANAEYNNIRSDMTESELEIIKFVADQQYTDAREDLIYLMDKLEKEYTWNLQSIFDILTEGGWNWMETEKSKELLQNLED